MTLLAALNPRRSLRARFALVLGGSGLAFAMGAAVVVDRYERAQLENSLGQAMRREALLLSRSLNLALQDRLMDLRQLASVPILASGLMEAGDLRLLLEGLRNQQPSLAWLAVTDGQGRVKVATNALQEGELLAAEPWFATALKGPWIGQRRPAGALAAHLGLGSGGQPPALVDLGVPLIDFQGRTLGVLVARLRWDWLDGLHRSMQGPDRRLPDSETLVLDRQGQVLLGPADRLDSELALDGLAALRAGGPPGVLRWPREGDFVTALGQDISAESGGADGPGLTVVVRQPAAVAFHAADVLRQRLLLFGGAATLVFMGLSLWLAGRIARPIRALSAAAAGVGRGEAPLFSAIAPRRRDEVAELAQALQALHAELTHRLAEQERATERYESLFRNAPVAIYISRTQVLQMANLACLQLFGASELAQLVGKSTFDLVHPDDHALIRERVERLRSWKVRDPAPPVLQHRIRRLDGSVAEVESTGMPVSADSREGVLVVLRDVTEARHAQALVHEREAQLAQTSRMAHVGGWSFVIGGTASWTDEMARIYELPPDTVPTREMALSYFHGEHRERLQAAVARAIQEGVPYDLELELRTPAGHVKWVRTQGYPVQEGGRTVRLEGITQDITERRAAEEALRVLNAELEQRVAARTAQLRAANAELDAFAYAVSHDLRAPLRAMSGFSQALVEDCGPQLDAEGRGYVEQIQTASVRMGGLIEGLLALSRSTSGAMHDDEVDLAALAERVVAELRREDPARQVDVRIAPGLRARGDRRMLDVVMHNLIGNAWKYTGRCASPRIEVCQAHLDGADWFVVADNGAGFDMAHAGRLFKAFARLHRQDEFPGIGVGLATVQRIVHRHGGEIVAQGVPGQGARFRFTLPVRRAAPSPDFAQP